MTVNLNNLTAEELKSLQRDVKAKLDQIATESTADPALLAKVKAWVGSPVGAWDVTTEGDVEGRSIKHLGTFIGHVSDIALYLADQQYYSLQFKPAAHSPNPQSPTRDSAVVQLCIASNTWDLPQRTRAAVVGKWLESGKSNVKYTVEPETNYASVKISRTK